MVGDVFLAHEWGECVAWDGIVSVVSPSAPVFYSSLDLCSTNLTKIWSLHPGLMRTEPQRDNKEMQTMVASIAYH